MSIVLVSKAKPQDCDALRIFKDARRMFLGYPLCTESYDSEALGTCLVNPLTCPDEQWCEAVKGESNRRMHSRYRNVIREVEQERENGAIAMVPRPSDGVVHVGWIIGPFEIVNAPPWGKDYLELRERNGVYGDDETHHHVADVAQGWPVDEYRRINLSSLPGWLRRATMRRDAVQVLPSHPLDPAVTAYAVLAQILSGETTPPLEWTLGLEAIKRRLVNVLNPYSLENLVVSLLQLENQDEIWRHTGGPGDGGIDGVGSYPEGATVGLLQVKFSADPAPAFAATSAIEPVPRYVAVLLPEFTSWSDDGAVHLGLDWIARRVQEHWKRLPLAMTMRVGAP